MKSKQKTENDFTKLGPAVCLIGKSGIGKTWAAREALGPTHVELTCEILRSKQDTVDFLEKVRGSDIPILLDEYETIQDLIGLRELTEPPTRGLFLVTSQIVPKFDFKIVIHEFPVKTFEQIKALCPEATEENIKAAKGDLRWVFRSLEFDSDPVDDFQTPKDFVMSLVSTQSKVNPAKFIGHPICEPGNIASILNANYVDAPKNKIDMALIANHFSEADIIETRVFDGDWDLLPYFNLMGCIMPALAIGHVLKEPLKPGSTWTKYQNMCMRHKKLRTISQRIPHMELDVDAMMLLRNKAEAGDLEGLLEYKIEPQDVDVMNHLSPLKKLKPSAVSTIKKWLTANAPSQ